MTDKTLVSTGVAGLDHILRGGLTPNRLYLIQGDPGAGKTTLGLQFLLAGVAQGESCLYMSLSETPEETAEVAASHGWDLQGLTIHDVGLSLAESEPTEENTLFYPSEVELHETMSVLFEAIERTNPRRLVIDSLSELRLLAQDSLRQRRQVMRLRQFLSHRDCTVMILDDRSGPAGDAQLQSLAHGVITLEQIAPEYGNARRHLRVIKMRGRSYRGGYHDFTIRTGGHAVFPRLVAAEHSTDFEREPMASGLEPLDRLLGGGPTRGSTTLVMGASGTGKSSLIARYAFAVAARGEPVALFVFDEGAQSLIARSAAIGTDLTPFVESGLVQVRQIDPAELSPGEFADAVRLAVEGDGARMVAIDSLNGYLNAMPAERHLDLQLHELLSYLGQRGVLGFVVLTQHGIVGDPRSAVDVSYLSDTILLLRFFEAEGRIRRAISAIKKRTGNHEDTIRELRITSEGLRIGEPLADFQGVLSGTPIYVGHAESLMVPDEAER